MATKKTQRTGNSQSIARLIARELRSGNRRKLPLVLCGAADDTTEAFALFRTGPHQPWHLVDLYDFEFDAKEAMQRGKADMHTDGMVIRHVTLGPVTRWNRPRPRARKTATKRTKAR